MKSRLLPLPLAIAALLPIGLTAQTPTQSKPPLTLDAYFAEAEYSSARLSPDGTAAVIAVGEPDWTANRFREDLWLWRASTGKTEPLTNSGHDSGPDWSPDGQLIAFTSDRPLPDEKPSDNKDSKDDSPSRLWIISADGGGARPLYLTKDDVHSFAWAPDGSAIYLAIQQPLSKDETDAKEHDWKDVTRYRTGERGDLLLRIPIPALPASAPKPNAAPPTPAANQQPLPEGATIIARSPLAIESIQVDRHSGTVAFVTGPISHRLERPEDTEIYSVAANGGPVTQLTHNQGLENNLRWSPDGERLYFTVQAAAGSVKGPYHDVQGRLYSIPAHGGEPQRLGADFDGNWQDYTILSDGTLLAAGTKGTSTQVYRIKGEHAEKLSGIAGTYGGLNAAVARRRSPAYAFRHPRAAGGLPRLVSLASRSGQTAHPLQRALSRLRAVRLATLHLEILRRHKRRRRSDLSARPARHETSPHAHSHPRWSCRCRWRSLRRRLV